VLSIEQRVFTVESFARKKTYRKCIHKFRHKYPDSPVPTASCVSKLVKKWQATGSVSHNIFIRRDPFFNQLTAEERQHGYFQQDNATAHTANATTVAIREVFEDKIIYLFVRCEACLQAEGGHFQHLL
jgi:hypothetical protein